VIGVINNDLREKNKQFVREKWTGLKAQVSIIASNTTLRTVPAVILAHSVVRPWPYLLSENNSKHCCNDRA